MTGRRPIISGINPYFTRSSVSTWLNASLIDFSFPLSTLAPKPIDVSFAVLLLIISSSPGKAPPQINKIFSVLTWTYFSFGLRLPPLTGTLAIVPSTSFKSACWTPSPAGSFAAPELPPDFAILSISSRKMIPRSAFSTFPSAERRSFVKMVSTSSPTYPASVREVQSAIAKGTSSIFATVWASRVFPLPVGPISRTLLFDSLTSDLMSILL